MSILQIIMTAFQGLFFLILFCMWKSEGFLNISIKVLLFLCVIWNVAQLIFNFVNIPKT